MRNDIDIELTGPEQVSGRTKTVAFRLTFTGENPETVADVTNAVAAFYVEQNDQMRSRKPRARREFLKAQLDDAREQLTRRNATSRLYTTRHAGELPQQVDVNLAALDRLNTQLRLNGERLLRALDQRVALFADMPPGATIPSATWSPGPRGGWIS